MFGAGPTRLRPTECNDSETLADGAVVYPHGRWQIAVSF